MKFLCHVQEGCEEVWKKAQSGTCLPYKHEDLNVYLQDIYPKLGAMMPFWNFSAEEIELAGKLV